MLLSDSRITPKNATLALMSSRRCQLTIRLGSLPQETHEVSRGDGPGVNQINLNIGE